MPQSLAADMARFPGVDEASPVFIVVDTRTLGVVYGIDYASFSGSARDSHFSPAGPSRSPMTP